MLLKFFLFHLAPDIFPVFSRRLASQRLELAVEMGQVGKSRFPSDGRDGLLRIPQQATGMADTDFVQYGKKSFSGPLPEMAAQGARVHTDLAGKPF